MEWRKLIGEIRKVYSGKLTYAANFNQEFEHVKFWDVLDFIGIQAYFSLSKNDNPSSEELANNWIDHLESIEKIHKKFNKPVIFTEIGYRSTEDAAIEPWKWPQENRDAISSIETQARCYEAFFKSAWKKDWLVGVYFWKWYPQGTHRLQEIDFTPQGKLAEKILFENFKGSYDK
jgi:exo-beta-1,3-glucanase (GH17 family)